MKIHCPLCGVELSVDIEIEIVRVENYSELEIDFKRQIISHTCGV
jgi:hypothetical protein